MCLLVRIVICAVCGVWLLCDCCFVSGGFGFAYVCSFTLVCVAFGLLRGVAGACERVVCLTDWFLC